MLTLSGWKTTTTTLLIARLPLQTFDEALPLIEAYIADAGGWVPTDPNNSTGEGEPANGATPEIAVSEIIAERLGYINRLNATVSVDVTLDFITNLPPGQADADVIAQMRPLIATFIEEQLRKTSINYSQINDVTGDLFVGGELDPEQRAAIAASIADDTYRQDARAIALRAARSLYTLDSTFNVTAFYNEQDKPIMVIIRKYTADNYVDVDSSHGVQYAITVNRDNFSVVAGVEIPIQ